jgi:hypothetical protein
MQAHRYRSSASDGAERRCTVPKLSPGAQLCRLIALRRQPHPAAPAGRIVCPIRYTHRAWPRRPYRAPAWAKITAKGSYRDPVRSSRSFFDQRPALALEDAARYHSLDQARVGLAVSHLARTLLTLSPGARAAARAAHRLGTSEEYPSPTVAARAVARGHSRQLLRRAQTVGRLSGLAQTGCRCDTLAVGYGLVLPGPVAAAWAARSAAQKECAAVDTGLPAQRLCDELVGHHCALVCLLNKRHMAGVGNRSVVGSGHSAHDAGAVGTVLARDAVRSSVAPRTGDAGTSSCLVQQGPSDLLRHPSLRPTLPLPASISLDVARRSRRGQNPECIVLSPKSVFG